MRKQLMKGNEAVVKSAILRWMSRVLWISPSHLRPEITEAAALYMPPSGGVFLQAESEVASINMLYGRCIGGAFAGDGRLRADRGSA